MRDPLFTTTHAIMFDILIIVFDRRWIIQKKKGGGEKESYDFCEVEKPYTRL